MYLCEYIIPTPTHTHTHAQKVAKICIKNGIGESMRRRAEFEERLAAFNAENHGMNCDTLEVRALKEVGCPIDVILTSVRGVFGPLVSEYVLGRIIEAAAA
jgi:hypothetical protein